MKPASTLYQSAPEMSRDEAGMKAITKMAAQVAKDHPTLEVLDGMRVANVPSMIPKIRFCKCVLASD
jgi:hypothetical protein